MKSWLAQEKAASKSPELKLNITKLMVGMMMSDEYLDESENDEIVCFLTECFDLSIEESKSLIEQITREIDDEKAFDETVKHFVETYSIEDRAYVLSIIWRIALIDGEVTFHEDQYLNHLAKVFEVSATMLNTLKKEQECDFPNLEERDRYQEF
ncbi:MAG: TerB family tellurite resistance protein [Mariprofundaceae bacterium]